MEKSAKIGLMPGGIDSLMFALKSKENTSRFIYFVPKYKIEEKWVKSFLPKDQIVCYKLKNQNLSMAKLDFEGVLKNTDIAKQIKNSGVNFFLLHHGANKFLDDWQKKAKVKIIGPDMKWQKLEDKIFFDNFLTKYCLPKPKSEVYSYGRKIINIKGRLVLQDPCSSGGEGTYFLENTGQLKDFFEKKILNKKKKYLLRHYIDGRPFGITIFISPNASAISALRVQCYGEKNRSGQYSFSGIQWVKGSMISKEIKSKVKFVFSLLTQFLENLGYFGYANIDFIIGSDKKIYIIECNPRFAASTFQLLQFPETIGGLNTSDSYLNYFFTPVKTRFKRKYFGFINSNFDGSVLHIEIPDSKKSYIIKRQYKNGLYKLNKGHISFLSSNISEITSKGNEFIFYSDTQKGEKHKANTVIGIVISNFPLYSSKGEINKISRLIVDGFLLV